MVRAGPAPTQFRQDRGKNADRSRRPDQDSAYRRWKDVRLVRRDDGDDSQHSEDHHGPHEHERPNLHVGTDARRRNKAERLQSVDDPLVGALDHEKKLGEELGYVAVAFAANVAIAFLRLRESGFARRSFERRQLLEQHEERLRLGEENAEILFDLFPSVLARAEGELVTRDRLEPQQLTIDAQHAGETAARGVWRVGADNLRELVGNLRFRLDPVLQVCDVGRPQVKRLWRKLPRQVPYALRYAPPGLKALEQPIVRRI